MSRHLRHLLAVLTLLAALSFCGLAAWAQQSAAEEPAQKTEQPSAEKKHEHGTGGGLKKEEPFGPAAELAEESREAAGEDAQFKQSASVRWFASITGMSLLTAYWILVGLNFLIIAVLIYLLMKAKLPGVFRDRSVAIRRQLEEARRASADAQQRLSAIESRLGKLDSEIAAMKASAEQESRAEEERIRTSTEQERQKIVASAEQEIAAAAGQARRELKAYVAELAVALAEKRIQVNSTTDEELVQAFVDELGQNGR